MSEARGTLFGGPMENRRSGFGAIPFANIGGENFPTKSALIGIARHRMVGMATTTVLLTVAEFVDLPDPPDGYHELRDGEVVRLSYPPRKHQDIQRVVTMLLAKHLAAMGPVWPIAFRPTEEHNIWQADVAFTIRERWEGISEREWLVGSPDLVVEVLSPSNAAGEMNRREQTCFAAGCRQFWTVDPDLEIVKVSRPNGSSMTYAKRGQIDLAEFGGGVVSVGDIFAVES